MSGQKILYKTQSVCKIDSQACFRLHVDLKSQAEIKNLLESKREKIFNKEETTKNYFYVGLGDHKDNMMGFVCLSDNFYFQGSQNCTT